MRGPMLSSTRTALNVRIRGSRFGVYHNRAAACRAFDDFYLQQNRAYSLSTRLLAPVTFAKPSQTSYQSVQTCPEPSCQCATTPSLPEPIDREAKIAESAPGYLHHVVISTGRSDWSSRIEDEGKVLGELHAPPAPTPKDRVKSVVKKLLGRGGLGPPAEHGMREVGLARGLKGGLGRKGAHFDPMRPMLISNSSFPPPSPRGPRETPTVSAYVFPSFTYVSNIPDTPEGHESFICAFLSPEAGSADSKVPAPFQTYPIQHPVVLICSHGARDARCGILGPVLYDEFRRQLGNLGIPVADSSSRSDEKAAVSVGMVSHIGGHKWAGNVIVYLPKNTASNPLTSESELGGKGVWYGRVEPRHVEGIIRETIVGGQAIADLCRGVRG